MHGVRRIGFVVAGLLVFLLGAAWMAPPFWDWSRQRDTMEALAAAALGRPVRIEGGIRLTLLPEPMLTAGRVLVPGDLNPGDPSTPDQNTGELRIRSLRLGVALWPLLRGRVVARELVLRGADLHLPWPPSAAGVALPTWYAGFAGRIEDAQVSIGPLVVRDIQASIAASDDGALSVSGRFPLAGQVWQLTARSALPGIDGSAAVDLTLAGRDRAMGTSLAFAGTLGGAGGVAGKLSMQGPDLSVLLPAPAQAFRAEGKFRAGADRWSWEDVGIDLGGLPMRASFALPLTAPPVLRASVEAARINADTWLPALAHAHEALVPLAVNVRAEAVSLAGGIVRQLRAGLAVDHDGARLSEARAVLPGDATLRLTGLMRQETDGAAFDGRVELDAPDPRASLRWLISGLGGSLPALPTGVLRRMALSGNLALGPGRLALSDMTAHVDASQVSGQITARLEARPTVRAELVIDRVSLDPFLPEKFSKPADILAALPDSSTEFQLHVGSATLAGRTIEGLAVDGLVEPERLLLRRVEGVANGAWVSMSGAIGAGGRIADAKLEVSAETGAAVAGWLPAEWRGPPALWDGRFALRAEAAGPADALAMQIGIDLGDARMEAQPVLDVPGWRMGGRVSLRHPNAARLLAVAWPAAAVDAPADVPAWPGEGSLALQAQFNASEDQLSLDGFELTAGALRAGGRLGVLWVAGVPRIGGRIAAETLPLPWPRAGLEGPLPMQMLHGWSGGVYVQAARALLEDASVAEHIGCMLTQDAGVVSLSGCVARLGGGDATIDATLDGNANPPALAVRLGISGGRIAGLPGQSDDPVFGLRAEQVDLSTTIHGAGHSPGALRASLSGPVRLTATDGVLTGFDLPKARADLTQARSRPAAEADTALRAALASGETPFDHIAVDAVLRGGVLEIGETTASGPAGDVRIAGSLGLDDGTLNLRLVLQPAPVDATGQELPALTLTISGPSGSGAGRGGPRRVVDTATALRWLGASPP